MASAVASRYARALVDLVMTPAAGIDARAVAAELLALESAMSASPELRQVLQSPAVPPARKRALVAKLAGPLGISRVVRNFLCVVIDRRRTRLLPEIRQACQAILDERSGIARAEVASARELSAEQRAELSGQLAKLTGKRVECQYAVNENLIGGATARIGSTIYDGSVRGQLEALRRRLASEQHAGGGR
jgi:F-type H+-transporting ATPase subunit delta